MASNTNVSPSSVVIDANVAIALCANELEKVASADAKIKEYSANGCRFFAPGVLVAECLYVFCRKLKDGVLTPVEHYAAVQALAVMMGAIDPPPNGDRSLIKRAEEIRGVLGCSRSADGIYLALADELAQTSITEVLTFDTGMTSQAAALALTPKVVVLPTA